ncbi:MAG: hypothetical protein WA485_26295 [Candidatus Sulfotelmatobacter sp.]
MDSDFADKLKAALRENPPPQKVALIPIPETRAAFPGNFKGSIQDAFNQYRNEYAGKDFEDPRGVCVTLLEENFPKLIKLRYQPDPSKPAQRARAKAVLESLRNGTFDERKHFSEQPIRLRTLFWIKETICNPDAIHTNCAARIDGEEVYFKRYDRSGVDFKLVFTAIGYGGQRIVITSFLDEAVSLHKYCSKECLWPIKK